MKKFWKLWALSLGEKVGDTDSEANAVAVIRTTLVTINLICCFCIMANILLH
jgi:hypothetical protein